MSRKVGYFSFLILGDFAKKTKCSLISVIYMPPCVRLVGRKVAKNVCKIILRSVLPYEYGSGYNGVSQIARG